MIIGSFNFAKHVLFQQISRRCFKSIIWLTNSSSSNSARKQRIFIVLVRSPSYSCWSLSSAFRSALASTLSLSSPSPPIRRSTALNVGWFDVMAVIEVERRLRWTGLLMIVGTFMFPCSVV